jgi:hypothetical protein
MIPDVVAVHVRFAVTNPPIVSQHLQCVLRRSHFFLAFSFLYEPVVSNASMTCHPAFSMPASFLAAAVMVNAATDAATTRLDALPTFVGDITFDVDRAARVAIDDINTRWVYALALRSTFHSILADNPSVLHEAVLSLSTAIVTPSSPLALAAVVDRVARLQEQVQTWCGSMEQFVIQAQFAASLQLLEANCVVVRTAAMRADLILKALYTSASVVIPTTHELEELLASVHAIFHLLDDNLQVLFKGDIEPVLIEGHIEFRQSVPAKHAAHVTSTYDGFHSLGAIGSEPSFDLACHLAHSVRTPAKLCSNCRERPVSSNTRCFSDWCRRCDFSLWISQPQNARHVIPQSPSDSD